MTLNASKAGTALLCWKKAFNQTHRGLRGEPSQGMVDGSAFHAGVAHGLATNDWMAAQTHARLTFDLEMAKKLVMPGEEGVVEDNWKVVQQMIQCYDEAYKKHPIQILCPEVKFKVSIPGTEHHDITTHWVEKDKETGQEVEKWNHFWYLNSYPLPNEIPWCTDLWEVKLDKMDPEAILEGRIQSPHSSLQGDKLCPCYLPHQLRGITDAIVKWGNFVWLLEHKTSAWINEIFWSEFQLDLQITMYLYGIWKSMGMLPKGAIINAIHKPSEKQVQQWNKKKPAVFRTPLSDYISFDREPITREEKDLQRFEREITWLADEWEGRILSGRFPMSPVKGICTNFNRLCQYHLLCLTQDNPTELIQLQERLGKKRPVEVPAAQTTPPISAQIPDPPTTLAPTAQGDV